MSDDSAKKASTEQQAQADDKGKAPKGADAGTKAALQADQETQEKRPSAQIVAGDDTWIEIMFDGVGPFTKGQVIRKKHLGTDEDSFRRLIDLGAFEVTDKRPEGQE